MHEKEDTKKTVQFEKLLENIEELAQKLEKGDLSLEASLKSYEKGMSLVKDAQIRLGRMEGRIEQLMKDGSTSTFDSQAKGE